MTSDTETDKEPKSLTAKNAESSARKISPPRESESDAGHSKDLKVEVHEKPVESKKNDDVDASSTIDIDDSDNDEAETSTIEQQCEKDKLELSSENQLAKTQAADSISTELLAEISNDDKNLDSQKRVSITILNAENGGNDQPIKLLETTGYFRIGVAVLTLSSILLANMNRQAFNQALTEMILPAGEKRRDENDNRLEWTNNQAGELKSAFSMGYAIFMIPSARLGEIMGTKWIVFASTFGSGLCSALVPYLAYNDHFTILKISRFAMGVCQAGVAPALFAIVARWLSPEESGIFLPLIKGGVSFGLLLGTGCVGFLSWQASFYLCGGVALVFAALWVFYVTSLPEQNKLLSKSELEYIQQQMQLRDGSKKKDQRESLEDNKGVQSHQRHRNLTYYQNLVAQEARLWARIFLNWPVAGIMLVKWTMRLSTDAQTQYLPDFFKHVHHLSKGDNSTVNCINYAIQGILTIHVVWLVNYCLTKRSFDLNKTGIRRLFQCGCSFGMAASYMLVTVDLESLNVSLMAVVLLALTNILQSGADSMMPYDLSPTYSGTIMGVANSFANSAGVILPKIVRETVGNEVKVLENWRNLFWVVSALIGSGGFIFILLVKAKVQPFDPAYEQSRMNAKLDREARAKKKQEIHIEMSQLSQKGNNKKGDHGARRVEIDQEEVVIEVATSKPKISQLTFSEWRAARRDTPEPASEAAASPVEAISPRPPSQREQ